MKSIKSPTSHPSIPSSLTPQSFASLPSALRRAAVDFDPSLYAKLSRDSGWKRYMLDKYNVSEEVVRATLNEYGLEFSPQNWYENFENYSSIESLTQEEKEAYKNSLDSIQSGDMVVIDNMPFLPSILKERLLNALVSRNGIIRDMRTVLPLTSLIHLDLSHNQLNYLPDLGVLSLLEHLNVSHNEIEKISHFPDSLLTLLISNNSLKKFTGPNSLIYLDISNNDLESLTLPPVLQYCDASYNKLEILTLNETMITLIVNNNKIKTLDLSNCLMLSQVFAENNVIEELIIADIPEYYSSLKVLKLENNLLSSLPPLIGNMTSLTVLTLALNRLTSLPQSIGELKTLLSLTLNDNQLTSLPSTLHQLQLLSALNLSFNLLTELPPELSLLNVRVLDVGANRLVNVKIEGFPKLEELYLYSNAIETIEITVSGPLRLVDLSSNLLTNVPEYFKYYNIQNLYLMNNPIARAPISMAGVALIDP